MGQPPRPGFPPAGFPPQGGQQRPPGPASMPGGPGFPGGPPTSQVKICTLIGCYVLLWNKLGH